MKLTLLAAFAAFSLLAQSPQVAAKPETPAPGVPSAATAPTLPSTAKIWRLLSRAQSLRQAASETQQAKDAAAAEAEVQAEQAKLSTTCTAAGFVLGFQQDAKAENAGDLICMPKPKETPSAAPPVQAKANQ